MIILTTPNAEYKAKKAPEAKEIFAYLLGTGCIDIKTKVVNKEYLKKGKV